MNRQTWAERTFTLAGNGGYLDALSNVYPVADAEPRPLGVRTRKAIIDAMAQSDGEMLATLLRFRGMKFPFNDPFIGFLRAAPDEIETNPGTVARICLRLRDMGEAAVMEAMEAPIDANRRMGQAFSNWLERRYQFISDRNDFERSQKGLVFYQATERQLRDFANDKGCGLSKNPDFVAKANGRFVVGEAKWLGTEGGNQNRGLDDALKLAGQTCRNALTAAVLDGILWIRGSGQMSQKVENFGGNAMSALLLDEFLRSL